MSEAYTGEIRLFGGSYAPQGWLACNGQLVNLNEYQVLYSLIGTTYGGDGQQTFGLPDLRGRLPVGQGQGQGLTNRTAGQFGGTPTVTLLTSNLPAHTHTLQASTVTATTATPGPGVVLAAVPDGTMYTPPSTPVSSYGALSVSTSGDSSPHNNVMPTLAMSYIICANGIYPNRP